LPITFPPCGWVLVGTSTLGSDLGRYKPKQSIMRIWYVC
jgi:hypothetical protein